MQRFNPPGCSNDFERRPEKREAFAKGWDAIVDSWLQENVGLGGGTFYNPPRGRDARGAREAARALGCVSSLPAEMVRGG